MAKTASTQGGEGRGGRRRAPAPMPPAGSGPSMFSRSGMREVWGELKKVQWPTRAHVVQGTLVVGFVTAIFAIYLNGIDFVLVRVVENLENFITG